MKAEDAAPTPVRGVNAKRLGFDTDPAARRAQDQQIVLLNRVQLGQRGELINGLN